MATLASGQYGRYLVSLFSAPFLARALGAAGRGEFALFTSFELLVVLVLGTGFTQSFGFEFRAARESAHEPDSIRQANGAVRVVWLRSVIAAPVVGAVAFPLMGSTNALFLFLLTIGAPSAVIYGMHRQYLAVSHHDRQFAMLDALPALVFGLAVIALAVPNMLSMTVALIVLVATRWLRFLYGYRWWPSGAGTSSPTDGFRSYGYRAMPATLAQFAQGSIAQFALLPSGTAAVGLFAVAQLWASLLNPFYLAGGVRVFRSKSTTPEVPRLMLALFLPAGCLAVIGYFVVPWLFGEEFAPAAPLAALLSVGSAGTGCFLVYRSVLDREGKPEVSSKVQLYYLLAILISVPAIVARVDLWITAAVISALMLVRGVSIGILAHRLTRTYSRNS